LQALCEPKLKSLLELVGGSGHRLIVASGWARLARSLPAAESLCETATPGDRMESWDIRSLAIEPYRPPVLRSDDVTRPTAIRLPSGEELQEHQVRERAAAV
jgi:hypothetical protein